MAISERMKSLEKMLEKEPDDLFLLYAIALEHKKAEAFADALKYLGEVLKRDALYCVAYQQAAQVHELAGETEEAILIIAFLIYERCLKQLESVTHCSLTPELRKRLSLTAQVFLFYAKASYRATSLRDHCVLL